MPAAGVVMIIAVVAIVAATVFYLVSTIVALRRITAGLDEAIGGVVGIIEKSAPVEEVVNTINANLDAGVDLLEGLLVKKAGLPDAVGLIEGLYPGAAAQGLRNVPESTEVKVPRISEVYTRGTLTLARLGREAPIAAASPNGPALRNPLYGSKGVGGAVSRGPSRPGAEPAPLTGDRRRLTGPIRPRRGRRRSAQADAGPARELTMQTPARFDYERATSVEGAIAALVKGDGDARVIAGGHSLLPMMKLRLAQPERLIDINDLTSSPTSRSAPTRSGSGR